RVKVPLNGRWAFQILVIASTAGQEAAAWEIRGAIRNLDGITMLLAGAPNPVLIGGDTGSGWAVAASADPVNDALMVRVVGSSFGLVRWVATVRTTELVF